MNQGVEISRFTAEFVVHRAPEFGQPDRHRERFDQLVHRGREFGFPPRRQHAFHGHAQQIDRLFFLARAEILLSE